MVAETLLILSPSFKRSLHQIQVDVPTGISMTSYPGQLGQILTNLINNAVLHGYVNGQQGIIHVSARLLSDDRVELVVSDDGVGVPEANLRRIFDPFFTTKLGQGGSGLGLNIVYNLMKDVLGGTVQVQSTLGAGTRFILVMPRIAPNSLDVEGD
jgi:signal transduction histidine kinase